MVDEGEGVVDEGERLGEQVEVMMVSVKVVLILFLSVPSVLGREGRLPESAQH